MQLSDLSEGQCVRVENLSQVSDYVRGPLMALGVVPGAMLSVVSRMPFNGPICLQVIPSGHRVMVRPGELACMQLVSL